MRVNRFKFTVALLCAGSPAVFGASLPESYPLSETEAVPAAVDTNFDAWLAQHADQPSPLELDAAKFDDFVHGQDAVTAHYLRLIRLALDHATPQAVKAEVGETLKMLESGKDAS